MEICDKSRFVNHAVCNVVKHGAHGAHGASNMQSERKEKRVTDCNFSYKRKNEDSCQVSECTLQTAHSAQLVEDVDCLRVRRP